jgi:hypothetical protein
MKTPPYFCAFLQGGDYIINLKIDRDPIQYLDGWMNGHIQDIWIKYKKYEWFINISYPNQHFKCSKKANKLLKVEEPKTKQALIQAKRHGVKHTKYTIELEDMEIIANTDPDRVLKLNLKENFMKNNPNAKDYLGAVISKKQLRYIKNLKEVLT